MSSIKFSCKVNPNAARQTHNIKKQRNLSLQRGKGKFADIRILINFWRFSKNFNYRKKVLDKLVCLWYNICVRNLGVAQIGSALPWGGRGRRFKSCHSDHFDFPQMAYRAGCGISLFRDFALVHYLSIVRDFLQNVTKCYLRFVYPAKMQMRSPLLRLP